MQTFQQSAIDPFPALTQACSFRLDATRLTLLAFLVGERLGTVELAETLRLPRQTALVYLCELEQYGLATRSGNGKSTRWTCSDSGVSALRGVYTDIGNALRTDNKSD